MLRRKGTQTSRWVLLIAFGSLIHGCSSSLENIEKFGATSAAVKELSNNISNDVYQSCLRIATKYSGANFFPNRRDIDHIISRENNCEEKQSEVTMINNANTVLIDYMVNIGRLASKDVVSFDKNLDQLEASIRGLGSAISASPPDAEINAGLKIARFIFNQLTLKFRRDNLKRAITCADPEIQLYTQGLTSIVEDYYLKGILRTERTALNGFYTRFTAIPEQQPERLTEFLFRKNFGDDIKSLREKENVGQAYVGLLQLTAKTHGELKDEFNKKNLSTQQLELFCAPLFAEEVKNTDTSLTPKILSPFDSESYTAEELTNIEKILVRYDQESQPLFEQIKKTQIVSQNQT